MLRYLALVWDARRPKLHAYAESLRQRCASSALSQCALDRPGLLVFCSPSTTQGDIRVLEDSAGVVLGPLFTRAHSNTNDETYLSAHLGGAHSTRIIESRGRDLIEN